MKSIVCRQTGDPSVFQLVERPVTEPGDGEVRVRIVVSGVNPTGWKSRRHSTPGQALAFEDVMPGQLAKIGRPFSASLCHEPPRNAGSRVHP